MMNRICGVGAAPLFASYRPACLCEVQCRFKGRFFMQKLQAKIAARRAAGIKRRDQVKQTIPFVERMRQRQLKDAAPKVPLFPRRSDIVAQMEHLAAEGADDVWVVGQFCRPVTYSVSEALSMHRETLHPTAWNVPRAPVRLRLELNMNLEKKNRFVPEAAHVITLPHTFEHGEKRTILAFANDPDQQQIALEAGAEHAGGPDLVKKIMKGVFKIDDFDFCVGHLDMMQDMTPMKTLLKHKYPTEKNGGLSVDLATVVKLFRSGLQYKIHADPEDKKWGLCDTVIGKLDMPDDMIEENAEALIKAICTLRPITKALGNFVERAYIMVKGPSKEYFLIDHLPWCPPIPEEDEVVEKPSRSTRKKKAATG